MNKKLTILLFILFATAVVVLGCLKKPVTTDTNTSVTPSEVEGSGEIDTSDWKTYRNEEYGFEFKYPGEWEVIEEKQEFWFTLRFVDDNTKLIISNVPTGFEGATPLDEFNIDSIIFRRAFNTVGQKTTHYLLSNAETIDKYFIYGFSNLGELKLMEGVLSTVKFL